MYIARFNESEGSVETLKGHLLNVSFFGEKFGLRSATPQFLKLAGLLHDIGKYTDEFQGYITRKIEENKSKVKSEEKGPDHGEIGRASCRERV